MKKMNKAWREKRIFYRLTEESKEEAYSNFLKQGLSRSEIDSYEADELGCSLEWNDVKRYRGKAVKDDAGVRSVASAVLYSLVRKYQPKMLVETGIHFGVSSTLFLLALKNNGFGKLVSIGSWKDERRGSYIPESLKSNWTEIVGRSQNELPKLSGNIDFFCHDSEHSYDCMLFEYEWALAHMKKGVIVTHDIGASNAFFDFTEKHSLPLYLVKEKSPTGYGLGVTMIGYDVSNTISYQKNMKQEKNKQPDLLDKYL